MGHQIPEISWLFPYLNFFQSILVLSLMFYFALLSKASALSHWVLMEVAQSEFLPLSVDAWESKVKLVFLLCIQGSADFRLILKLENTKYCIGSISCARC